MNRGFQISIMLFQMSFLHRKEAISGKIAQISLSFMQQGSKMRLKNCEILYSLTQFDPICKSTWIMLTGLIHFTVFLLSLLLSFSSEKSIKRNETSL